jgi:hypothetical protein
MLEEIKKDLAENYRGDDLVLKEIIDETTTVALSISNRKNTQENINLLKNDIKKCVKGQYIQRGAEGSNSLSDGGKSTSFNNPIEIMRIEIVKSGKRVPFL